MIDNGDMTVCAIGVDGMAWCWGQNEFGRLGTGDLLHGKVPRRAAEGYSFRKISESPGGAFTCGISTTGKAYCWGSQAGGRLGDGTMAPGGQYVTSPLPVAGDRTYTDIAAGGDHTCAIATGGAAYCWGQNGHGQLGTGNATSSAVPVPVAGGHLFTSITAQRLVTCAIALDGSGFCWGEGENGNLGTGSSASSRTPAAIKGGLTFSSLRLGLWTTCGVATSGDGYCWGFNGSGELGIGSRTPQTAWEPMKVSGGLTWRSISPGVSVTCGVAASGTGYCWGGNLSGERGTGTFPSADITSPEPVVGDLKFESIDADWCSCGIAEGVAYCWGPGNGGCVGDGALADRGVPTKVAGQS